MGMLLEEVRRDIEAAEALLESEPDSEFLQAQLAVLRDTAAVLEDQEQRRELEREAELERQSRADAFDAAAKASSDRRAEERRKRGGA